MCANKVDITNLGRYFEKVGYAARYKQEGRGFNSRSFHWSF
jgi:hypothetical protein